MLARSGFARAPNFPLRDLGDFDAIKIGIILIHFPVEESIQIPRPLSFRESGSFFLLNWYEPGVGLNKILSRIIQMNGINQIINI